MEEKELQMYIAYNDKTNQYYLGITDVKTKTTELVELKGKPSNIELDRNYKLTKIKKWNEK